MIQHSPQLNELAAALAKAQGEMKGAVKDSVNPHFKSKFADLSSIWDACRQHLSANGLAISQCPHSEPGRVHVTTILMHSSGQWLSSTLTLIPKDDSPQSMGSAVTYARRYTLAPMVGVVQEDDDGHAASHSYSPPRNNGYYNDGDDNLRKTLYDILHVKKVDQAFWPTISKKMHGKPSVKIDEVIKEVLATTSN